MTVTWSTRLACFGIVAALGIGGCAAAAETGQPGRPVTVTAKDLVRVTFDGVSAADGVPVSTVSLTGTALATATVVTKNSGFILSATARPGQGRAVQLPAFNIAANAPGAVVRITNPSTRDQLNPGTRNFSFGADFVLDATSSQSGTTDDGDNLLQRGLFDDAAQYKLQLDGRRPSCRLKGSVNGVLTSVDVTSTVEVDSTHWYRAECVRTGVGLDVVVQRFHTDGTLASTTTTSTSSNAVIQVRMSSASVPLSVGGKLNLDGTVQTDSDQFNGRVDNAYVRIT